MFRLRSTQCVIQCRYFRRQPNFVRLSALIRLYVCLLTGSRKKTYSIDYHGNYTGRGRNRGVNPDHVRS